jgi:hypothetical protein
MAKLEDERQPRSYPHGSGDRNASSPTGEQRMPVHDGGAERKAPLDRGSGPAPSAPDAGSTDPA